MQLYYVQKIKQTSVRNLPLRAEPKDRSLRMRLRSFERPFVTINVFSSRGELKNTVTFILDDDDKDTSDTDVINNALTLCSSFAIMGDGKLPRKGITE